ncbi:MAG TPA: flavodoxin [Burkholderiales bacterium]|nr:flavodoxin [Burkholderiales bacterium]
MAQDMEIIQRMDMASINEADTMCPFRRKFLKATAAGLIAGVAAPILPGQSSSFAAGKGTGNVLIAYFSRTGNTREVANQIHQRVGGDIMEIRTLHPYPDEYRATTEQAKREQDTNFRPQLTPDVKNMDSYDAVFIGYPIWWGTLPMAFFAFLEKYNFGSKTLIPFCTHEGSHLGRSVTDMMALCPSSAISDGLALRGGNSGYVKTESARRDVAEWLSTLRI